MKEKAKKIFLKFNDWFKKFFSIKRNKIIVILVVLVILIIVLLSIFIKKEKDEKFSLNSIYDLHPEVVRKLYSNVVEVSCSGDMHLDIQLNSGKNLVKDIKKEILINYLFSHLDKNKLLNNDTDISFINMKSKEIFADDIKFDNLINNFQYNNYIYNVNDGKITRNESSCNSDIKYVSYLYGYSYNEKEASMDVNIGYLKDGILYDLSNNKLGSYSGDIKDLRELFMQSSFYRYNYIKEGSFYKLSSVEWNTKS